MYKIEAERINWEFSQYSRTVSVSNGLYIMYSKEVTRLCELLKCLPHCGREWMWNIRLKD